ncbi:MAG: transcriptional regulator [Thermoprotei archaeon]
MSEEESETSSSSALKELADFLDDSTLKSSIRLLIVISLALNRKLGFTDLLELTGTGKGSLSNHLDRLASSGYIKLRIVPTLKGPRTIAEITQKGLETYQKYLVLIEKIRDRKTGF